MIKENNNKDSLILLRAADATVKAKAARFCNCPGSEPGKVKIDSDDHLPGCRFWKRSWSSRYGTKTLVIPTTIRDGYGLAVTANGGEEY